jgi:hypothetical protein
LVRWHLQDAFLIVLLILIHFCINETYFVPG